MQQTLSEAGQPCKALGNSRIESNCPLERRERTHLAPVRALRFCVEFERFRQSPGL